MSVKKELEAIDSIAGKVNETKREQLFEEYSCENLRMMIRKTMHESQRIIQSNEASKQRLSELKCNNTFILEMLLSENNIVETLQNANCKLKRDILLERMKKEDVKKHFDEEISIFNQKWKRFKTVYESSTLALERTQLNKDIKKLTLKLEKNKQDFANMKEAYKKWQNYKKVLDQQLIVKFALHAISWPSKVQSAFMYNNSIYNKQAEIESLTNKQVSLLHEIEEIKKQYIADDKLAQASEFGIPKMDTPGYIDLNVPKDYSSTQIKSECDVIQDLFLRVSTSLAYSSNANKIVSRLALENLDLSLQNIQRNAEAAGPDVQATESAYFARDIEQVEKPQNEADDTANGSETEQVQPTIVSSEDDLTLINSKPNANDGEGRAKVNILESVILDSAQVLQIFKKANLNINFLKQVGVFDKSPPNKSPLLKRLKASPKVDTTASEQNPKQKMESIKDQFDQIQTGDVTPKETEMNKVTDETMSQIYEPIDQPEEEIDEKMAGKNPDPTMPTYSDIRNSQPRSQQSQPATPLLTTMNETGVTSKNITSQETATFNNNLHQTTLKNLNQTMTTCCDTPNSQQSEFATPLSRPLNESCNTPKDMSSQETTSSKYNLQDTLYKKFKMTTSPQFVYAMKTLPVKQSANSDIQNVGIEENESKFFMNEPQVKVMTAQAMFKTLPKGDSSPDNFNRTEFLKKAEVSLSQPSIEKQVPVEPQRNIEQSADYKNDDENMQSLTTLDSKPGDKMLNLTIDEERQDESMTGEDGEYDFSRYLNSDAEYMLSPKAEEDLSLTGMENNLKSAASIFGFNSVKTTLFGGFSATKPSETAAADGPSAGFSFDFADNNQEKKKKSSFLSLFN